MAIYRVLYKKRVVFGAQVGSKLAEEPPSPGNNGTAYCGSCYGAQQDEHQCCNTCDEVRGCAFAPELQLCKVMQVIVVVASRVGWEVRAHQV